MPGMALTWDQANFIFDLTLHSGEQGRDFLGDAGLLSAVIISLFTDRRARDDDPLPDERVGVPSDRRGWWGDYLDEDQPAVGSRLWLLWREKDLDVVVARAEEYAREALAWLTTEQAGTLRVERVDVSARRVSPGYLGIGVRAVPPAGMYDAAPREWNFLYDYENAHPVRLEAAGTVYN